MPRVSARTPRVRSLAALAALAFVQEAPQEKAEGKKEPEFPPFAGVIEGLTKVVSTAEGSAPLYELYCDKSTTDKNGGRLLAVLPAAFAEQELMIAVTITSGHPEAGVMGPTHYGSWRRIGKQLAFVEPDLHVRSDDAKARDAVTNLYPDTLLLSVPILTLDGARPVIDLGRLATQEVPRFFASGRDTDYGPSITALQAPLATLTKAKAFPQNVVVEYEAPQLDGRMLRVAYSIGKLEGTPGFVPRKADARVGYYYDWHVDTTSGDFEQEPSRYINRWDLEKADPSLALSPPKRPLVWYVEHTTPVKYRRYVKEGIQFWNEAFEKVGIVGALEVYQQDASTGAHMDKDPEDARYNFFRWNMSQAAYAIGPSRTNPRTGEILDADVVWNQGLTRVVGSMLGTLSKSLLEESSPPELLSWYDAHPRWDPRVRLAGFGGDAGAPRAPSFAENAAGKACRMGQQLSVDLSLASAAFTAGLLDTESDDLLDGVPEEFLGPMIRYISAHEVGHCLGLQHNMAASNLVPLEQLTAPGYRGPVSASVMDYVAPNLGLPGSALGGTSPTHAPYVNERLGPYDLWAIAFGYGDEKGRAELLAQSSRPEHLYLCQAGMSTAADPRNQTWDTGARNLDFCEARMKLVNELRGKLTGELVLDGEPWARARRRYEQLLGTQLRALVIAASWIGSSYESQDAKGSPGAHAPVEDVPAADQRRALAFLVQNAFEDGAFGLTPELVRHFGKEYWYDPPGASELQADTSYTVHDLVGGFQALGLTLALNPARLRRVYDNEFRTAGAEAFTLHELLATVTDSVWRECRQAGGSYSEANPLCSSFRRNLQYEHVSRLTDLVLLDATTPSLRAIGTLATAELKRVDELAKSAEARPLDPATQAHLADLRTRIAKALDAAYVRKG